MPEIKQDIRATTFVVASNDSLHRNDADYVCDGAGDEVEINQALNALPAQGGKVVLLEGTYTLAHPIVFPDHYIILEGEGWNTLIDGDGLPTTEHGIVISGFSGCEVKHLAIQTENGGGKVCHCIFIEDGANEFVIDKVYFMDSDNDAIHIEGTSINKGWILDNFIEGADDYGIFVDMDALNPIANLIIKGNYIASAGVDGIFFGNTGTGADHCIISLNVIASCVGNGIYIWEGQFLTINDNTLDSNTGYGIYLRSVNDSTVEDNVIQQSNLHNIYLNTCAQILVEGNYTYGAQDNAADNIHVDANCSEIQVMTNYSIWAGRYGIFFAGSRGACSENRVQSSGDDGIRIDVADFQCNGNHINDCGRDAAGTYHGIKVSGTSDRGHIIGNYIMSDGAVTEDGIELEDGAQYVQIIGNYVFDCMGSGIALIANNDSCQITDNFCLENDDYGIEIVAATCNDNFVDGNHLLGNVTGELWDAGTATHFGFNSVAAEVNVARVGQALGAQGVNFTTIQAAINFAATQAPGAANPWTVEIYPGIYDEVITCSSWVNLKGVGPKGSVVIYRLDSTAIVILADNVEIADLTLRFGDVTGTRSFIIDDSATVTARFTNLVFELATPLAIAVRCFYIRGNGSDITIERCFHNIGGTGTSEGIRNLTNAAIFHLVDNDFTFPNVNATHILTDQAGTWTGGGNRWAGTCHMFNVSAGTITLDNDALLCTAAWTNTGSTITLRHCAIEAPVVAGNLATVRMKNCSYRAISRAGTGNIVDESPQLQDAPWKVHKWTWMAALANMDVAVRGTPLDAGSGQILLEVNTGGAADQEATETNPEAAGSLGNEFTPARTPRFITQITVDEFHADADMFFGLRETLGNAVPAATEDHAGFIWNGTNFIASSDDGVASQTTVLTTPTVNVHVQLEVIVFGGVTTVGWVEFYIDGVLVATHNTRIPVNGLDWQHLLNNGAGGGAAADIDVTVRNGGVAECPA